ncbi:P-loop NTPase fold protein [Enterococcus sp.]|uniref:P-loop NTPase fold protein n=1 Tax=Enterococcus sp. TaxID=35783 RepID=UPI002914B171|nr:P-loop NTPase fold protein [Enterococcus sp.]MDU5335812.1 P-loop NTPase fold protein [Enterococcus sp.]
MNKMNQIIDNYMQTDEPYALQVDGEWGTGKTYYVKNHVIDELKEKGNFPIYFSVYGYNILNELKQDILYNIISELSSDKKVFTSMTTISKKFRKISNVWGDQRLSSISLISDWILESKNQSMLESSLEKSIVVFIDDLERISEEISVKDLLGFILNELMEKLNCKVIILSNSNEIDKTDDFKKMKEKVIGRTINFAYDISEIERIILKKSRNTFIKENSLWIRDILEEYQNIRRKKGINLRTLLSVIENYSFVESKLFSDISKLQSDKLEESIRKSIFLNVFVVTNEYKLGNITENDFDVLKGLSNTRYFDYYLSKDEQKSIKETIIDQYHHKHKSFDDYIFYSNDIHSQVLFGFMDDNKYVSNWKKNFVNLTREISNLDKLSDFRRFTDNQLKQVQKSVLTDVEENKFNFKDLITVYGRLNQLKKMNLMFLENSDLEVIETKLIESYSTVNEVGMDLVDEFYIHGIPNIKLERPELYQSLKDVDNQRKKIMNSEFIKYLFNDEHEELYNAKQNGFLRNTNIFKVMLEHGSIDEFIMIENNKSDLLWRFINSEYLRISNAKDFHGEEIEDIYQFLNEIKAKMEKTKLGRIDRFKINQLIESLEQLIEHLK